MKISITPSIVHTTVHTVGSPSKGFRMVRLRRHVRRGQSMVETVFVMIFLCFIFFVALQLSQLFAAKEIINHASNVGARAKAVGFNDFMIYKAVRVASIPIAGKMRTPQLDGRVLPFSWPNDSVGEIIDAAYAARPRSPQAELERIRIPDYLYAQNYGSLSPLLDYEDWDEIRNPVGYEYGGQTVSVDTRVDFELKFPFHSWFYADDSIRLRGKSWHADHHSLYLE